MKEKDMTFCCWECEDHVTLDTIWAFFWKQSIKKKKLSISFISFTAVLLACCAFFYKNEKNMNFINYSITIAISDGIYGKNTTKNI